MNILFVGHNNKGWLYETLYYEQLALSKEIKKNGGSSYFFGPGFRNCNNLDFKFFCKKNRISYKDIDIIIFYISHYTLKTGKPDLEVSKFYKCPDKKFIDQLDCMDQIPRFLWLNDFWQANKIERIVLENKRKISHILSTYFYHLDDKIKNKFFLKSKYTQDRIFHINRSVHKKIILKNINQKRNIDISLLGAIDNFYPERKAFLELLQKKKYLNFFYKNHPGYNFQKKINNKNLFGTEYFKILKKTKIFVTCGTKYNLPIIKIYEVLASGCLLMCGKINNLKKFGLIKNKNFVEINTKNLLYKLNYYIKNPKKIASISSNGLTLVKNNYTNVLQAKKQFNIIKNIKKSYSRTALLSNLELFVYKIYLFFYYKLKFIKIYFFFKIIKPFQKV
jgi:hypothetical protein